MAYGQHFSLQAGVVKNHCTSFLCVCAACRDVKACIAFPAWMHNYLATVREKLPTFSGFDLTKLIRSLADLGYKPARPFLNEFAAAAEVGGGT